ncbi:putative DNA binding protein [Pseudoalteromonas phage PHS21]|nr:putative DNA binding protein [Pseudoalteromonas phage PHS21]
MKKSRYGFGVNDANYKVTNRKAGWVCPYYKKWRSMINRCYSPRYHLGKPTYINDTVCPEWELFSEFKSWMESHEWNGLELDKDVIDFGNRTYSPDACCFIPRSVNSFVKTNSKSSNSGFIGVHKIPSGKFEAHFKNPISNKIEHIGTYLNPEYAHEMWRINKLRVTKEIVKSGIVKDDRAKAGLLSIFEEENWYTKNIKIYRGEK